MGQYPKTDGHLCRYISGLNTGMYTCRKLQGRVALAEQPHGQNEAVGAKVFSKCRTYNTTKYIAQLAGGV